MGNSHSYCQPEPSAERAIAVEEQALPSESTTNETAGSIVHESVTANTNNNNEQGDADADVVVVTSENIPEVEEEEKKTIVLHTAPIDPRFPGTNASRYCYVAYNEYHKCANQFGKDAAECKAIAKTYRSICPSEWIAAWNELREEGTWFGKY